MNVSWHFQVAECGEKLSSWACWILDIRSKHIHLLSNDHLISFGVLYRQAVEEDDPNLDPCPISIHFLSKREKMEPNTSIKILLCQFDIGRLDSFLR